jgi:hypothetical protein
MIIDNLYRLKSREFRILDFGDREEIERDYSFVRIPDKEVEEGEEEEEEIVEETAEVDV